MLLAPLILIISFLLSLFPFLFFPSPPLLSEKKWEEERLALSFGVVESFPANKISLFLLTSHQIIQLRDTADQKCKVFIYVHALKDEGVTEERNVNLLRSGSHTFKHKSTAANGQL